MDFNEESNSLNSKRKELFEQELLGKITSAGRIYRKIIAQDRDFIQKFLKWASGEPNYKRINDVI